MPTHMSTTIGKEVWKTYPDHPFIEASNLGRVRTKDRIVVRSDGQKQFVKGKVLKQQLNRNGYMQVGFRLNGKLVKLYVHRISAITFIPNPDNLPEVNHKDNDRTNNVVSNLEWCTSQYNTAYREKYGVPAKESTKVLRESVIAVNPETSEVFWFESQSEAARQLGISQGNINNVVKGRYNQTGGYWFCYADENAVGKTRKKFGNKVAEKVEKLMNNIKTI